MDDYGRSGRSLLLILSVLAAVAGVWPAAGYTSAIPGGSISQAAPAEARRALPLRSRIVATGIPGAGAISPVGTFHPGGPIHDNPEFASATAAGKVLDPTRILVASTSNFGAPPAANDAAPGAVLSIDPVGEIPAVVPADFAAADGQAAGADGRVQLFTAQSAEFTNAHSTPSARTAELTAASNPLALSINNAFGRVWIANAPWGNSRTGTITIADPNGQPLAGAPSAVAGGVFAGQSTNREPAQEIPGTLNRGAVGTALVGRSPDGSGRAVFAAVGADGSLTQVHTEAGLDGLAPAGTIAPLPDAWPEEPEGSSGTSPHAGVVFNWVPDPILYVADPLRNAIAALALQDDGIVLHVARVSQIAVPELNQPVDLAPAVPEIANPAFSSNTTLAGGADLYALNRGNGTIVRVHQDGTVVSVRSVELPDGTPVAPGLLNGIAVSPDAGRIWVTVAGGPPGSTESAGLVLELPAFGAPDQPDEVARAMRFSHDRTARGAALFQTELTPEQGLGPLFNGRSCLECHNSPMPGGMGENGLATVVRVGRASPDGFDPLAGRGGPVARSHSIAELDRPCPLRPGIPSPANVTSVRNAPPLFGLGEIDKITDAAILANAVAREDGVHGRPNLVVDTAGEVRIGRFGWKADVASLEQFVAEAFRNEQGVTSPLAPDRMLPQGMLPHGEPADVCGVTAGLADDGTMVNAVTDFVGSLVAPQRRADGTLAGEAVFSRLGCAACHVASIIGGDGQRRVPLYSDLLVHDMGATLDDGVPQGSAGGQDWRTTPLWGLGQRQRYLHDGRARDVRAAILAHGGEAAPSTERFRTADAQAREALLAFLRSL